MQWVILSSFLLIWVWGCQKRPLAISHPTKPTTTTPALAPTEAEPTVTDPLPSSATIPGAPENMQAVLTSEFEVAITWIDPAGILNTYQIERLDCEDLDDCDAEFQVIATVASFRFAEYLDYPAYYFYRITAMNAFGQSSSVIIQPEDGE